MTDTTEDRAGDSEALIGLFEPAVADDPHPTYARLRSECPVARGDMGGQPGRHDQPLRGRASGPCATRRRFTSATGLELGDQPLLPLEVDPPLHTDYRRILNPQFVPTADRAARARGAPAACASCSTASSAGARATSTPSSPRRCRRASSSRSWVCPIEDLPQFLEWRDNTIRPDVEPGDVEGAAAHPQGDRPRHQRLLPRARSPSGGPTPTTRCCRRSSTPTSAAGPSTRRSCSASATCCSSAGSTP